MGKFLKTFFVSSLLVLFLYNVSGVGVAIEHARHSKDISAKTEHSKSEKSSTFSQDENCQCALHMQMHHSILPETVWIHLPLSSQIDDEKPQPKASTFRSLLDDFSSRAPPFFS